MRLFQEDAYGAREEILRRVDLLLAEPALRELVSCSNRAWPTR
jgi:hypothetical protein